MTVIKALLNERNKIKTIYKDGIGRSFFTLRYILPLIAIFILLILIESLNIKDKELTDLISQINSLIGIILGFSIASFAIFISISNDKLGKISKQTEYTYREIGGALFFYNVEVSLFASLIGILLLHIDLPIINVSDLFTIILSDDFSMSMLFNINIALFIIFLFLFFQLIFNLFYSSIFLHTKI
ncbi:MAG: hypothetical protein U9R16_04520 [Campylobacterota bacterium]|nr:hypothetical protein [Campylobacterota bacterium]